MQADPLFCAPRGQQVGKGLEERSGCQMDGGGRGADGHVAGSPFPRGRGSYQGHGPHGGSRGNGGRGPLSARQKRRQRGTQQEARKEQPVQMVNLQQFRPPEGYVEVGEPVKGRSLMVEM